MLARVIVASLAALSAVPTPGSAEVVGGRVCPSADLRLVELGPASADPERGTQGYVCTASPETTGTIARPPLLKTWVGATGPEVEKRTLGYSDGYGIREGDDVDE